MLGLGSAGMGDLEGQESQDEKNSKVKGVQDPAVKGWVAPWVGRSTWTG